MRGLLWQGSARSVTLPMSRTDIADFLGLTVETVCRTLAHLRCEGSIAAAAEGVALHNLKALRQMAADLRH